jgi:DNA-binding CsgD family transcriptional regulator
MELANATMHLIQKNKFMTKLKGDLMRMWGEAQVDSVKSDIKQIVRKIDKDFKNEQHWKVFDKYFDEVHQDFIQRIKEKHTILTPNDLRLCAYLRMNLSTKEIAPLMNISVRGLEISRYRLRKKLELEREVNLIDYIMEI